MDDKQKAPEEVVESVSSSGNSDQVDVLFSLEEMIKNHIASLDSLRDELKKQREMFEDVFINDETFRLNSEKVKEATKAKNTTRQQILNQPAVSAIANKVKSIRTDIKERQGALSDYLQEYQRMTGATEIEGKDGQVREIVNNAKVVKPMKK